MAGPRASALPDELARHLHEQGPGIPWAALHPTEREAAVTRAARALDALGRGPLATAVGAWYRSGRVAAVDALDAIAAIGADPDRDDTGAREAMRALASTAGGELRMRWDQGVPRTPAIERLARALVATALRGEHADGCPVRSAPSDGPTPDPWRSCACEVLERAPLRAAWIVEAGGTR